MREIKFRGKSYETGEWVIGNVTLYYDEKYALIEPNLQDKHEVDWDTVGEYISLTDHDGVEVFTGDLLEGESRLTEGKKLMQVHFLNGCFMVGNYNANEFFNMHTAIKVLGNIYDNKELLV